MFYIIEICYRFDHGVVNRMKWLLVLLGGMDPRLWRSVGPRTRALTSASSGRPSLFPFTVHTVFHFVWSSLGAFLYKLRGKAYNYILFFAYGLETERVKRHFSDDILKTS